MSVGDRVRVIAGPDRGLRGRVVAVYESGVFSGLVVIEANGRQVAAERFEVRKEQSRG